MAVLVEAISVIVRRDAIEKHYIGGWDEFQRTIPNATACFDDELVRVGFMDPDSVRYYVDKLEQSGLVYQQGGKVVDIVICDQLRGPTTACDWIEFGRLPIDGDNKVAAAWLFEGPRFGAGLHLKQLGFNLVLPAGWEYKGSLSDNGQFVEAGDTRKDLEFLRVEGGVDVYWNKITNKEVYVGRVGGGAPLAPGKRLN